MSEYLDPCNLIVNYIPSPVTDDELRELFIQFGSVISARIIREQRSKTSKGYGFVKYASAESARDAMRAMNGFSIHNKRLKVTVARGPDHGVASQNSPTGPLPPPYNTPSVIVPPQFLSGAHQNMMSPASMMQLPMFAPMMSQQMNLTLPSFNVVDQTGVSQYATFYHTSAQPTNDPQMAAVDMMSGRSMFTPVSESGAPSSVLLPSFAQYNPFDSITPNNSQHQ